MSVFAFTVASLCSLLSFFRNILDALLSVAFLLDSTSQHCFWFDVFLFVKLDSKYNSETPFLAVITYEKEGIELTKNEVHLRELLEPPNYLLFRIL